jgi:hypothetical protein
MDHFESRTFGPRPDDRGSAGWQPAPRLPDPHPRNSRLGAWNEMGDRGQAAPKLDTGLEG